MFAWNSNGSSKKFLFLANLFNIFTLICGQLTDDPEKMLNWCLDSNFHKKSPSYESELYKQCTPWKTRSCCSFNTTYKLHTVNHHNFNLNHCSMKANMSDKCRQHFIQDFCFFECSPNIGPWVVEVNMKKRKERFYKVPLCKSDCEVWFDACKYDFTCADNWYRYFNWDKDGNHCIPGTECLTFEHVFGAASNFCEMVWDNSWKVVNDSEPCMRLWFNGAYENPNDEVALLRTHELLNLNGAANLLTSVATFLSTILLHIIFAAL